MTEDKWMYRAIDLALKGGGFVNPNPKVGAVIVKDGKVIGEGYHEAFGQAHAEVNAILNTKESCRGATLYVTLEPCFHYGKTPPCVDLIVEKGFKKVVIGMKDPNPRVSGKSINKLLSNKIEVEVGILEEACENINPGFLKLMREKRPYVLLKGAMTLDGKIATAGGESQWISGEASRRKVHDLRHEYQAIIVGINTVLKDDPLLNTRRPMESVNPIRIIVDSKGRIPMSSQIVKTSHEYNTLLATTNHIDPNKKLALEKAGLRVLCLEAVNERVDIKMLLKKLGELSIASVLLEGGGTLNDAFLRNKCVDEVIFFIAPMILGGKEALTIVEGEGVEKLSEAINVSFLEYTMIGKDLCIRGKVV